MAIFNSYVNLPEGNFPDDIPNISTCFDDEPPVFTVAMEAMALLQMIYPPKKWEVSIATVGYEIRELVSW